MIPTSFDYVRAGSVKEALNLLAAGDGSKVIAGGHSLLPMMRFRLVQVPKLVDISRIDELKGVQEFKKGARIGAATTYADLATSPVLRERCPIVAEVASTIADIQVRNRGTIGGSLAHADPASDMPAVMVALDAEFQLRSKKGGRRTVKARDFFQGAFSTAMTDEELFTDILLGPMGRNHAAYVSFDQAASGYALVGVCAVVGRKRATISEITVAYTGIGEKAFLGTTFEQVNGTKCDSAALEKAAREAVQDLEIAGDVHAPGEYRRHLARVAAIRAVSQAYERAGS
ncbi:MAG TPA: xanthine dehydrogenase family protein subunit M [Gemmatimonadales bacterium]|nr:xanthine dehydrogenase family protein subunit M [Gemmatimonadales bacterium]